MPTKYTPRYHAWLKQAQYDLQIAKISVESGFNEWATYQCEQAVEKALKAVIVHAGQPVPKMHKISVLIGYCNSLNSNFANTKFQFRHLDSFTFISRYPFLLPGKDKAPHDLITKRDAESSVKQAQKILTQIEDILEKKPKEGEQEGPIPVTHEELERRLDEVKHILMREFSPSKIVLFGSYAKEPLPKDLSTLDILVIAETDKRFIDRIKRIRMLTRGDIPTVEPLVYTPDEFKIMTQEEGESFLETALKEGRTIYDKTVNNKAK